MRHVGLVRMSGFGGVQSKGVTDIAISFSNLSRSVLGRRSNLKILFEEKHKTTHELMEKRRRNVNHKNTPKVFAYLGNLHGTNRKQSTRRNFYKLKRFLACNNSILSIR
jgi:hypothetical protein